MFSICRASTLLAAAGLSLVCHGDMVVKVHKVTDKGVGNEIGTVTISQAKEGVKFKPDLKELKPGEHGFHVHEHPSCNAMAVKGKLVPAMAAGGHYDPDETGRHAGPEGDGHKGDLPRLEVNDKGMATKAVVAPRLTLDEVKGRSLMIHEGGDNYSDNPPMGGGGARIACGVIE